LSYLGHALVEKRNGLIAAAMVTHADGYAALSVLVEKQQGRSGRLAVSVDNVYDTEDILLCFMIGP